MLHAHVVEKRPIQKITYVLPFIYLSNHQTVIQIATIFAKIATDMAARLKEEEEVFFPAIKRADAARIAGNTPEAKDRETIRLSLLKLHREHEEIGDAVHTIRHLSKQYTLRQ